MITELCLADLFDLISEKGAIRDRQLLKALTRQICIALQATKNVGYAHLDLKLENILIAQDGSLRLCDFGFATRTNYLCNKNCGTEGYQAPEV
jgi:serine/threonine protein kinase